MNSLPTHYHCWLMTPSFLNPKRNPMIPLEQKLLDLNLTVMSHHLETTLRSELVTDPLSLLAYDAFILESEKESDDTPGTETPRSESDGHEPPSGDDPPI